MADIREEDFNRMQAQIIELRTANYDTEVKYQRQNSEFEQLREKFSQIEKELEKSNKVIQKSKNRKEYALLVEENEGLQHRLKDNEEHFKLQNKTLLEEVTRIEDENKKLVEEVKSLKSGKEGDSSPTHEAELRRLKAENAVLQKSLKSTQALHEAELQKLTDKDNVQKSGQPDEDDEISATQKADGDSHPATPTGDGTEEKPRTLKEILEEFTKEINSMFETFCNGFDLQSKNTEEEQFECMDGEVVESTSEDKNDDKIHCTFDQLENLKENVQNKISTLLEEKVVSVKINGANSNSEEANVKPSTQLTEIQLQLATEREEKHILEEQLATLEGNLRKEISRLEEDVNKLTEKAKRKQESLTQLQNEKENLFNENKKTIEEMKQTHSRETKNLAERVEQSAQELESVKKKLIDHQQLSEARIKELEEKLRDQQTQATSNVEETIQELDNTRIENSSLSAQIHSLHEACESYRVENEDQKAMMITMQDKMKDMENREIALKADNDKLKSEVEESCLSYEHLRRQVDETMGEKEQYIQSANEAAKLAEKRKQMLDEFSIDQQKVVAEHKEQLERLESSYKDEARKSQDEFKKTIEDLKAQLQGEKKLKKDLQESQQQLADVTSQLTSVESKSGWFERRLAETEETLNEEKTKAADTIEQIKKEHETNMNEIATKHEASLQELNEKLATMQTDKQEQDGVIEKYKQEIKDKDVENVIAGKKGDHLVKDLKRQLKMERKKNEQLQQRLQEACSENRARENFEKLFDPNVSKESGRRNSVDSSMLSGSSLTNEDIKEYSPDSSFNVSVNDETVDLISRVADLQQEKWQLEERVRLLEQSSSSMAEDLIRKSAVIRHYAMETKMDNRKDVASPQGSNFKSRMKETFNIGKQEVLLKDMNSKLQRMLEETLIKNIQMQQDIDLLTKGQSSSSEQEKTANDSDKT